MILKIENSEERFIAQIERSVIECCREKARAIVTATNRSVFFKIKARALETAECSRSYFPFRSGS